MKISFINPSPNEEIATTMINSSPPLGILYIASMLKNSGIEVSAYDQAANGSSNHDMVKWIMKEDPDIVGISTLLSSSFSASKIANEIKNQNSDIIIILGNHHATFCAEKILKKYPFIDIVVRGEGEYTCLDLIKNLEEKKSLKNVLGITYRYKKNIISNQERQSIKNIDVLPFPDRDLLEVRYHNTTIGINVAPKKFTSFLSSRGCVFKCRFCSCTSIAHSSWRPRSIDNIMQELHKLVSEGYKQIMFVDDNFTLNQNRVIKLCQRLKKEKIDLEWICEGRVDQCSENMLRQMVKAGCKMMYFGIESANKKTLDYLNKGISPEQSERAIEKTKKAGVDIIVGSFIIGSPNETKKDIKKTLDFTKKLGVDIPQINPLQSNPGTPLWDELKNKGLIDEDMYWETGVYVSEVCPNTVPFHEIKQIIYEYYKDFLRSPRYLINQIVHTFTSKYRLNVLFSNLNRINTIKTIMKANLLL